MSVASRTCPTSLSILSQLVRFMVSVGPEDRAQSLERLVGGEQTMIIDARANLELRDAAAKKTWWEYESCCSGMGGNKRGSASFPVCQDA